jgi:hypothetical protein
MAQTSNHGRQSQHWRLSVPPNSALVTDACAAALRAAYSAAQRER